MKHLTVAFLIGVILVSGCITKPTVDDFCINNGYDGSYNYNYGDEIHLCGKINENGSVEIKPFLIHQNNNYEGVEVVVK